MIHQENQSLRALDVEKAKELCKKAKSSVMLIDGWYTLLEAQEILEPLECDDLEIAFQVHADEGKKDGKLYIWTSN